MNGEASRGRLGWFLLVLLVPVLFFVLVPRLEVDRPATPPDEIDRPESGALTAATADSTESRGRIEGRVTRAGKGTAAELSIWLHPRLRGTETRRASADASGNFAFLNVPPGRHEITAVGPDGVRVPRFVRLRAPLVREFVEIELPAGPHSIRGRAVHADGRPFRGVVQVRPKAHADRVAVETDPEGRFVLPGLDPCVVWLEFRIEGAFQASGPKVAVPTDEEIHVVVDEDAREVKGRILALTTEAPIPGARVMVTGRTKAGRRVTTTTATDAEGRFQTSVPADEDRIESIEVEADGYWIAVLESVAWREAFTIRLDRASRLTVRVVAAANGRPVPDARVSVAYEWIPETPGKETRLSDAEGRAVFSRVPGRAAAVDVRRNGFRMDHRTVPEERWFVFLDPGQAREVEIPVVRTSVLLVSVNAASGEPVERVRLEWISGGQPSALSLARTASRIPLADLLPGDFTLQVKSGGLERTVRGTLGPGEVREVSVSLPAGARSEVEVVAADTGEPVRGARVSLRNFGARGATDDRGRVRLGPFRPGQNHLYVERSGFRTSRSIHDFVGDGGNPISVTLERGLTLSGTVLLPDRTPAPDGRVSWHRGSREWQRGDIAKDGTFRLEGLPPGDITVAATWTDPEGRPFVCQQRVRAGDSGVSILLEPKERESVRILTLVVTDPAGVPVPRADYLVLALNAEGELVMDDMALVVEGRARISVPEAADEVRVMVSGARRATSAPLPLGSKQVGPFPSTRETVEIALPPERVITGRVLAPDGRGLPRVTVEAALTPGGGGESYSIYPLGTVSGPDGAFRIPGLGAGVVEIYCYLPDDLVQAGPVIVGTAVGEVVIRTDRVGPATVTVRDAAGRTVEGVEVTAVHEAGIGLSESVNWYADAGSGESDENGRVRLEGMARNGSYRLRARPPNDLAAVRIDGWRPGETTITLPPGLAVAGRLLRKDGSPHSGEEGYFMAWGRARGWVTLDLPDEGRFRETGFAAGRVALLWIPYGEETPDDPEIEPSKLPHPVRWVDAGDEEIVMRVPAVR